MNVILNERSKEKSSNFNMFFYTYMKLILLFSLTTLFQNYINSINTALYMLVFVLQISILLQKLTKNRLLFLVLALVGYVLVLFNTQDLTIDNSIIYLINWFMYSSIIVIRKNEFLGFIKGCKNYIRGIMLLWTAIVAVSIPMKSSYFLKEGGAYYFGSFAGDTFRLCPTALFIACLALISIIVYERKMDIIFMIVPLYCGFMGSSRTYFLVIALVFLLAVFMVVKKKKYFYLSLVPILIVGIYLFGNSALSEKVAYTMDASNYGDIVYRLTSSRSVIWSRILIAYNESSLYNKIFGNGFGFTNSVAYHYAHNDFIEIVANHGMLGVICYLYSVISLFKTYFKDLKLPIAVVFMTVVVWIFNASFNMFYYYLCAALSLPFLLIATRYRYMHR